MGICAVSDAAFAQARPFTPSETRLSAYATLVAAAEESPFKKVEFRSVGPTVMSGRIVDIDVNVYLRPGDYHLDVELKGEQYRVQLVVHE